MQATIQDTVRTLIIPLQQRNLLVPNVVVAEIVPYVRPRAVEEAPEWLLGTISWRGLTIPILSFDRLYGDAEVSLAQARIAVLNTATKTSGLPFYAIVTAGIPQLKRVSESMLQAQPGAAEKGELGRVEIGTLSTVIPDLEALENTVAQIWNKVA